MLRYLLSALTFFFCPPPIPDVFNPEVPKLEKSVSGSSPSHDRVLLSVATLLVSFVLLS